MPPEEENKQVDGLKVANMVQSGKHQDKAIERAPGIFENRGIGNSYLLTTPAGNLLVNAGTLGDARRGKELFAQVSDEAVRYIVLTQSHANQFGGLEVFKTPENQVIAHRSYIADRQYSEALSEHYKRGSRRIFSRITGAVDNIMPTREVSPDILIDDFYEVELGDRRFQVIWTPGGETRSAVIVWLPDEAIAIVGNLFGPLFGNHPNLNTMRGDKPRSALQFIDSVKTVRALKPKQILTGHENILGSANIEDALTRIIDSVQWVHDSTIEGMNAGKSPRSLMRDIKTPPELTLTEEYGKVAWNVRAIWHEYTGWFDPSLGTTELYDVPPSAIAPAIVELSGGAGKLIAKARTFIAEGKPLEALHLLDIVLDAEPASAAGLEIKKEALTLLLDRVGTNKNLWETMWISAAIREVDDIGGKPTLS